MAGSYVTVFANQSVVRPRVSISIKGRDTGDIGCYIAWFRRDGEAMHFVTKEEHGGGVPGNFANYMYRMFVLMRYCKEAWPLLVQAIPAQGEPAWDKLQHIIADLFASGKKVFPGNYRATSLRSFRPSAAVSPVSTAGMEKTSGMCGP